jgi:hypothetical protein
MYLDVASRATQLVKILCPLKTNLDTVSSGGDAYCGKINK